ncbi:MAG: hypothetical protein Q8N81_08460 [bacterium]|nr:hypothetical protein [bacterium]
MSLKSFVRSLQARPYHVRVKILWLATAVAAIILFSAWGMYQNLSSPSSDNSGKPGFISSIQNKFNEAKQSLSLFRTDASNTAVNDPATPETIKIVLKDYLPDEKAKTLTIRFEVANSSMEILNFLNDKTENFQLLAGSEKSAPSAVQTDKKQPFPKRILGKSTTTGEAIFPLPATIIAEMKITNLYFISAPDQIFAKTVYINLATPPNNNPLEPVKLPRE